jgi:hypothetical protein
MHRSREHELPDEYDALTLEQIQVERSYASSSSRRAAELIKLVFGTLHRIPARDHHRRGGPSVCSWRWHPRELALPQDQFAAVSSVPCGFASLSLVSLSRFAAEGNRGPRRDAPLPLRA